MAKNLRFVDLSLPLDPLGFGDCPRIVYVGHEEGAEMMTRLFGCTREDLPCGLGWAMERVELTTHTGTHFDATWHFGPMSEGRPALTIDQVPLEYCYGPGVVLDLREKQSEGLITAADVERALARTGHELQPRDIVLIMTGADMLWGKEEYFTRFPGMGRDSTLWLTQRGVKVVGTDAYGWDRPFGTMAQAFARSRDRHDVWGGHFSGLEHEYFHIEKLANLDQLPPHGFTVVCFPIKIPRASAAWVRPVAIIGDA